MSVRVLLQIYVGTVARTVVGVVGGRRDDPVPAEVMEVDNQWKAAAVGLGAVVGAEVAAGGAFGAPSFGADVHLQHRKLPRIWCRGQSGLKASAAQHRLTLGEKIRAHDVCSFGLAMVIPVVELVYKDASLFRA